MTLFEKIIARQIPANIVHEDDDVIAFRDITPQAPTHVLVVPKKPIPMLADATEADAALLGKCLVVAAKVAKADGLVGYRVVLNNGAEAGQSVFHIHFHVLGGRRMS